MDCVYYVVGGDRRSCYMSLSLAEKGSNVFHFDPYDADLLRHSPVTIISGASGVGFRRLIEGECASPSVEMPLFLYPAHDFPHGPLTVLQRSFASLPL